MTYRALIVLAASILAGLAMRPAQAAVSDVSVSPPTINTAVPGPSTITVTWTVTRTAAPPTATVTSNQGRFQVGGTVLGTVNTTLSRSVSGAATVTFTETVRVPRSVIQRARQANNAGIVYVRTFTDGQPGTGFAVLAFTGAAGAGFAIQRVELRFDDDSLVRVVEAGERLGAYARINSTGNGLFQAVWEVADPTTTRGAPVFRPLRVVRRYLAGGRRHRLDSPPLPTGTNGLYLVRLRITGPDVGFDDPVIRYFVSPEPPGRTPLPVPPLALDSPGAGQALAADTRFAWRRMPGARAYQLEIYAVPGGEDPPPEPGQYGGLLVEAEPRDGPPVTGVVVPGSVTETPLAALPREDLRSGETYRWRVVALGEGGRVLAESGFREIHVP